MAKVSSVVRSPFLFPRRATALRDDDDTRGYGGTRMGTPNGTRRALRGNGSQSVPSTNHSKGSAPLCRSSYRLYSPLATYPTDDLIYISVLITIDFSLGRRWTRPTDVASFHCRARLVLLPLSVSYDVLPIIYQLSTRNILDKRGESWWLLRSRKSEKFVNIVFRNFDMFNFQNCSHVYFIYREKKKINPLYATIDYTVILIFLHNY